MWPMILRRRRSYTGEGLSGKENIFVMHVLVRFGRTPSIQMLKVLHSIKIPLQALGLLGRSTNHKTHLAI